LVASISAAIRLIAQRQIAVNPANLLPPVKHKREKFQSCIRKKHLQFMDENAGGFWFFGSA
jgi:hypothetical protein